MLTIKSKLRDLLANDEAYEIIHRNNPGLVRGDPRLEGAMNMSLLALLAFPASKCPKELRDKIAEELEDAEIE